jgi:hypothetical protein
MLVTTQMKLLISLAQIDGTMADREKEYIRRIGEANRITPEEMEKLFDQRHPVIVPEKLSDKEKFDCIFSLVQLMKIDERMYKEEILFCSTIATKLGYDKQVMFDLLLHVKSANMQESEKEELEKLTRKYLG